MAEQEKSIPEVLSELWQLLLAYGKQETIDPLKGLGRYILFGLGAAITGSLGIILIAIGVLRVLQTHTNDHLSGHWDWVPYLVALVVFGVLIGLFVSRIKAKGTER